MGSTMDFIVGLFLVSAGLFFGYFIWYRDRSGEESLRRKLSRENEDLRTSLKLAHNSHTKLDERFNRQQGQLNVLQQLCDDWSQGREQAERERAELEAQVAVANSRYEDTNQSLVSERQRRMELEDQLHQASQQHLQAIAETENQWRQQVSKLETSLRQQTAELETAVADRSRLSEQLTTSQGEIAALKSELSSQQQLLETATRNADGLELEYVTLESALADTNELLKAARTECASTLASQQVATDALESLRREHDQVKAENESLQSQLVELQASEQQRLNLQQALDNDREQLQLVTEQRDQAIESESSAQTIIRGLKQRLENQETTIHRMRSQQEEARDQLSSELKRRSELETKLEQVSDELDAYIEETESQSTDHSKRIEHLTAQRDQFADELEETRTELAELVASHTDAVRHLTNQRDQFADDAKTREAELAALLASHQQRIDELVCESNQQQAQFEEVCDKSEQLAAQVGELTDLCQELESRVASQQEEQVRLESSNSDLQQQLSDSCRVNELLQTERDGLLQERLELQAQQQLFNQQQQDLSRSLSDNKSEWTSRIETLEEQRTALLNELAESRDWSVELTHKMTDAQQTIAKLRTEINELQARCQQISELESLVAERDQSDHRTMEELRTLREQYADAYGSQQAMQAKLAELEGQRNEQASQLDHHKTELTAVRAKLKASEETIRNLRKERAAVLARLANQRTASIESDTNVISFTEAMAIRRQNELEYDDEYGGPVRQHAIRGLIYTEPPKQVDDLKRISGIAEVLEARLNDYGVYTFKQIMDWSPEAIDEFSHLLTFKDRIFRDDWVGQARRFYEEKRNSHQSYAA